MTRTLSADQLTRYVGIRIRNPVAADRYWAQCLGQDAAMNDEIVEKLKAFLQSKLSSEDHAAACALMDGGVEAQDDMPEPAAGRPLPEKTPGEKVLAGDSFAAMYPDMSRVRIDNSGISIPRRPARHDAAGAASFNAMFPGASRIKLA